MSANDKLTRYDNYVPMILSDVSATGDKWPVARLFLHLIEANYQNNGNIKFPDSYLVEADAHYHTEGQKNSKAELVPSGDFIEGIRAVVAKMASSATKTGNNHDLSKNIQNKSLPKYVSYFPVDKFFYLERNII